MTSKDLASYYDEVYEKTGIEWAYSERLTECFLSTLFGYFKIGKELRVLDVGCGTGFHDMILNKLGYRVFGIDISQVGLALGKKYFPNLQLAVGDAYRFPFREETFDVVFLYGCSLLNTDSIQEVRILIGLLLGYVAPGGMLICVEHTNLSGIPDKVSRRSNRNWEELHGYVTETGHSSSVLLTHFLAIARFGRLALTPFVSSILRLFRGRKQWMAIHRFQRTSHRLAGGEK
jgi:SAM-dependent methyltransferase